MSNALDFRTWLAASILASAMLLSACATTEPSCLSPQTRNLDSAMSAVSSNLESGCQAYFDR